jgi:hypothetical protein
MNPMETIAPGPAGFRVVILRPPGYVHSDAFREVAETVMHGLRALGAQAELAENQFDPGYTHIVFGSNLLDPGDFSFIPKGSVLYNLEQVDPDSEWITADFLTLLKTHRMWDYSPRNVRNLEGHGIDRVALVPIGYAPELSRIAPAPSEDIDVLFYGSMSPRREAVLRRISAAGLRVMAVSSLYGRQRDALIARSKLVLNLHYYATRIFETVRVSYLLANARPVVGECDEETEIDDELRAVVRAVRYNDIVDACLGLVADSAGRRALGERGLAYMRRHAEIEILRPLIAA